MALFYCRKQKPINTKEIFTLPDETIDTLPPGFGLRRGNYFMFNSGVGKVLQHIC